MKEYLLVDGYNIIHAWKELKQLADNNLESARIKLADMLCNYQGFKQNEVILVFDGYKAKGNLGSVIPYNNIDIVYTKEAVTADQFIEMMTQQLGRKYQIRVATSDGMEQLIILGKGAIRMTARELKLELDVTNQNISKLCKQNSEKKRNSILDNVSPEVAKMLEQLRLEES